MSATPPPGGRRTDVVRRRRAGRHGGAGGTQHLRIDGSGSSGGDWTVDRLTLQGADDFGSVTQSGVTLRTRVHGINDLASHPLAGVGVQVTELLVVNAGRSYVQSGGALFANQGSRNRPLGQTAAEHEWRLRSYSM